MAFRSLGWMLVPVPLAPLVIAHFWSCTGVWAGSPSFSFSYTSSFSSADDDYSYDHELGFDESYREFGPYANCFQAGGDPFFNDNGYCNFFNSNEACDYDGGDCCSCTCIDNGHYDCGENGYLCKDPSVSEECLEKSNLLPPSTAEDPYSQYPLCFDLRGDPRGIGDGWCHLDNDREECGYDGGDCCSCTCVDTDGLTCGSNGGYYCLDPSVSAECLDESNSYIPLFSNTAGYLHSQYPGCYEIRGHPYTIGDGFCEQRNNNEECAYDGGDCCLCTCVDSDYYTCGQERGFYCLDPSVPDECREASASFVASSSSRSWSLFTQYPDCDEAGGFSSWISNANCDFRNNIEECGYDGGDCCSCTCVDSKSITCGVESGYFCQDPNASAECKEESAAFVPSRSTSFYLYDEYPDCFHVNGQPTRIGDADCDVENNNEECVYDGGDCCSCTCMDTEDGTCGEGTGFYCLDPSVSAECKEESALFLPSSSSTRWYYWNLYPGCVEALGAPERIGDGDCDFRNSIEECVYDGGDCCMCTCIEAGHSACGEGAGYYCRDPAVSAACVDDSNSYIPIYSMTELYQYGQYPGCYELGGSVGRIDDGFCETENNIEECAYDGGDCCSCTCVDGKYYTCGVNGYDCEDPAVSPACVEQSLSQGD